VTGHTGKPKKAGSNMISAFGETNICGKKENQDAFLVKDRLFVVADGHGRNGALASTVACEAFASAPDGAPLEETFAAAEIAVTAAVPHSGGTTLSALYIDPAGVCHIGNVGDSDIRVYDGDNQGFCYTADHSPSSMSEFLRIRETHPETRIEYTLPKAMVGQPARPVFLQDGDRWYKNPAGGKRCTVRQSFAAYVIGPRGEKLAMTRALGDTNMKKGGVIATPACVSVPPMPGIRAIVIGSDGLWDVMRYDEVGEIVRRPHLLGNAKDATTILMETAINLAAARFGAGSDNITAVVVYC
jgi:serine/threonine protein phosphatase PrpC